MIALLFDIHGNLPALDAVIEDARAGHGPLATRRRLRRLRRLAGRDNHAAAPTAKRRLDPRQRRPLGRHRGARLRPARSGVAACREALDPDTIAALGALPESVDLGGGTCAWHASPKDDMHSFRPQAGADAAGLLDGISDQRLVFGHFHVAFERTSASRIELVAPGSVGIPMDGDHRAAYALLHDNGQIEHRLVAYDYLASAARIRQVGGDAWGETIARRIEQAAP